MNEDGIKFILSQFKDFAGNIITETTYSQNFRTYFNNGEAITSVLIKDKDVYVAVKGNLYLNETLIGTLHQIIPCPECQAHAAAYIAGNPLPSLRNLRGEELRNTVRNWLFNFHNQVRNIKGQPIIISTPEACREQYQGCFVPKCEYTLFVQNVAYAARQNWVRVDTWRKWYSTSEKMRILIGNIVM